jgi:transcriptional regulator with XRE-family HTH domain
MVTDTEAAATNEVLDWLHEALGLTWPEVARALGADRRTIDRWRRGRGAPNAEHRHSLADIHDLRQLLGLVFPDDDSSQDWLHDPVPFFHGDAPISLIRGGRIDDVVGVLAGAYSGAFI